MSKYIDLLITKGVLDEVFDFKKESYRDKSRACGEKDEALRAILPPEFEEAYKEVIEAEQELNAEETNGCFAAGVKFGINLLLEVLAAK